MTKQEEREIRQYIDRAIKVYIDSAIKKTVRELKKQGVINTDDSAGYAEAVARLKAYYKNDLQDDEITGALEKLSNDRYIDIIPLYFYSKNTIEHIASLYDVEISTITRNKKRLCMEIYKLITED